MFLPIAVAIGSVALGALVAWLPGWAARALGPIRTFALMSAGTVVVVHLFPCAVEDLGFLAFVGMIAGLLGPPSIERAVCAFFHRDLNKGHHHEGVPQIAIEISYVGLLVHGVADGVGLWTYAGLERPHADVALALAAHNVPVTALVVLRFLASRGPRSGLIRAAGLAVACVLGVLVAGRAPAELLRTFEPWVAAVLSGLLLHVIGEGLRLDPPRTLGLKVADLGAAFIGVALPLFGMQADGAFDPGQVEIRRKVGQALADLTLDSAPMLVVGLVLGAFIQALGPRVPASWFRKGGSVRQAFQGAVMGAPLPICACGILPLSRSLQLRGAGSAMVVSFLLTTPELGLETFALTGRFLGWPFATLRVAAAVSAGFVAALLVSKAKVHGAHGHGGVDEPWTPEQDFGPTQQRVFARFWSSLDELLDHVGPWIFLGLLAAAYVQVAIPVDRIASLSRYGLDVLVVTLISIPSYVCASSATPLAAILVEKGLSKGAALAGLILGPATNVATVVFLRKSYGKRALVLSLLGFVGVTWIFAFATNAFLPAFPEGAAVAAAHESHGAIAVTATLVLLALLVRGLWRNGTRAWLAALVGDDHGHGPADHAHTSHGAAHVNESPHVGHHH